MPKRKRSSCEPFNCPSKERSERWRSRSCYIADDDPRAAWASPAAVLDAVLGEGPLALAEIPAKLPWKVEA